MKRMGKQADHHLEFGKKPAERMISDRCQQNRVHTLTKREIRFY